MSKISERLKSYQTIMSLYAEQHKIILASDVLDMIEQLQDDLKDTIGDIVSELEKKRIEVQKMKNNCIALSDSEVCDIENITYDRAKDIVRKGGINESL